MGCSQVVLTLRDAMSAFPRRWTLEHAIDRRAGGAWTRVGDNVAGGTLGYDAFISYSHALDGALARALQRGVEQFAKPWYRPRALRVFRDTTSLSANPDLWSSIEAALASSAWLVLMASPEAARSSWVDREVAWWRKNKSPQRLLVVLTEGEFAWDDDGGRGDGTSAALPPALRGAFVGEPRWVDLRWLRDLDQVDQANPRLRECVADVAAAVREVPKDALVGEHIRQHRRTMRLARSGVTTLAVLLIAALVAAVVAVGQRNRAVAAQHTVIARGMVAQADGIRDRDPRGALRLGVAANQLDPSPLTQASLMQTLVSSRYRGALTGHTGSVEAVAFSPDGHTLATASNDQTVILWDLTDRTQPRRLGQPLTGHTNAVDAVAFAPDGHTLATASEDKTVILWDLTDRTQPRHLGQPLTGPAVEAMVFSPDGHTLVTASFDETVILWDLTNRTQPRRLGQPLTGHTGWVGEVAFSPDGHTLAASDDQIVILWDLTDRTQPRRLGQPLTGHTGWVEEVAFSSDGHTMATASIDKTVILWDLTPFEELRRDAVREACTRAGGSLDAAAWNFYAPGISYQDACASR
jgi:hypothetical protein